MKKIPDWMIKQHQEMKERWLKEGNGENFYEWFLDIVDKSLKKNEYYAQPQTMGDYN